MALSESHNTKAGMPLFSGNDYSVWKFRMEMFLREKKLKDHIKEEASDEELASEEWRNKDAKAMNFIVRCVVLPIPM